MRLSTGRSRQAVARQEPCRAARAVAAITHSERSNTATNPEPLIDNITYDDLGTSVSAQELKAVLAIHIRSLPTEKSYRIPDSDIKGTIPADLCGTLLRNGPGNFEFGSQRISHPFDGDGLVSSFTFDSGSVLMRRKFVRTKALRAEMAAQELLYKTVFCAGDPSGAFSSPFDFTVRSPANTGVVALGGRVLALGEAGLPYALDKSLRTLGIETLGTWHGDSRVAAHYRQVTEADGSIRTVMLSTVISGLDASAQFVELDKEGNKITEAGYEIPGGGVGFYHDFLVTENYYVLLQNPTALDLWKLFSQYMPGSACLAECLYHDTGQPMKIHCIPRPGKRGRRPAIYESASKFSFHHINAWEAPGDAIVIDTLAQNTVTFESDFFSMTTEHFYDFASMPTLRRIVVGGDNVRADEADIRSIPGMLRFTELPAPLPAPCAGRPYTCSFFAADRELPRGQYGPTQSILRLDMPATLGVSEPFEHSTITTTEYYPGDSRYCGEPIFVPKPGTTPIPPFDGRNGYLLVLVSDLRDSEDPTTWLEVLDAEDIAAGPIAAINLHDLIAPGLHGTWTEQLFEQLSGEQLPWRNDIRVQL